MEILECIKAIDDYKAKGKDAVAGGFRSRSRETPTYIYTHGLPYAITLLAARSSKSLLENGLLQDTATCRDVVERVLSMENDEKKASYGLYGALVLYIMKREGLIKSRTFSDLVKEMLQNPTIEAKSKPIFEWFKRLSEAYFKIEHGAE